MTTQFISRVDRNYQSYNINSSENIGPGSYNKPEGIKKSLPGFAPFTTTSKRMSLVNPSSMDTPNPGSYNTTEGFVVKAKSSSSAFKSKSSRFEPQTQSSTTSVNSSSYPVKSDFGSPSGKKPQRQTRSNNILDMIKSSFSQSVIPSIPTREQSYGYEEDPTAGKLIPQYPLQSGFTGVKNDTVGPLDYSPKINVAKFSNAPRITFGKDKKDFLNDILKRAASNPGPGSYNTFSSFDLLDTTGLNKDADFISRLHNARKHHSAIFESKTVRDPIKPKYDVPGPGMYELPGAIHVNEPPPPEKQNFNSSGPRFKDPNSRSMRNNVAPGQYNPITSDFDNLKIKILKNKRIVGRSGWAQNIAFATTEPRSFIVPVDKDGIPGPCSYNPKVTIADRISKPNKRSGPFGSTEERFKDYTMGDLKPSTANESITSKIFEKDFNRNMTPSTANNNTRSRVQIRPKYTSAFANTTRRFRTSADEPLGPPPTAYDTQRVWSESIKGGYKMKGPVPIEIRRNEDEDQLPGPGYYNIPSSIGETKSFNRKNVFVSTTTREEKLDKDIPGVGAYNIQSTLIRPTHNILLSDGY